MFERIFKFLARFLELGSNESPSANQESAIAKEKERLEAKLEEYNRTLAASAALCELLRGQIQEAEHRERACLAALEREALSGASEAAGGELALRLQTTQDDLADLREKLKHAQATCDEIASLRDDAIHAGQKRFDELNRGT